MARITFVLSCLVIAGVLVSVDAGCEWYDSCGACVADPGCGWCSNDPKGVGTGIMSTANSGGTGGLDVTVESNEGSDTGLNLAEEDSHGNTSPGFPAADNLVTVRGQSRLVTGITTMKATMAFNYEFPGSGYLASPYFGHTDMDNQRGYGIVGMHKTKFLEEIKAGYTVTPYQKDTYTVQSVQHDQMLTLESAISGDDFTDIEYQIGHYMVSGSISYPDTSKTTLHGSYTPNPTKFTTELKDGYVVSTGSDEHSDSNSPARVGQVIHDQLIILSSKFIATFDNEPLWVEQGPRGTGLISGTAGQSKMTGSNPCASGFPCHPETAFLSELRTGDLIEITDTEDDGTTERKRLRSVLSIGDDAHLQLGECLAGNYDASTVHTDGANECVNMDDQVNILSGTAGTSNAVYGKLNSYATFVIKTFSRAPYTIARHFTGRIVNNYEGDSTSTDIEVSVDEDSMGISSVTSSATLTKSIGAGYAVIVQVESAETLTSGVNDGATARYERRLVKNVIGRNKFTIDRKFSKKFSNLAAGDSPANKFHYESCPSLTYENFDDRTENGPGVISGTGASYTYDNTPYAEVTTSNGDFDVNVRVGFELVLRNTGVKRRVTKVVSPTKVHINRPFNDYVNNAPVGFSNHAYQIVTKKGWDKNPSDQSAYGSDHHMHWKTAPNTGGSNSRQQAAIGWDATQFSDQLYSHQMISSTTTSGAQIKMQDPYLLGPPVCYNNGRCVPKTSHSLVGVEYKMVNSDGTDRKGSIMSSSTSNFVHDLVNVGDTSPFYKDCKPTCTITATIDGVSETRQVVGTVTAHNSTHLYTELPFTYNGTQSSHDNKPVPGFVPAGITAYNAMTDIVFTVRYVTGTGTVHWCPNGYVDSNDGNDAAGVVGEICEPFTLTGSSKETKTKFNSETSPQWTVTIPCSDSGENRTISQVTSDTKLVVHETFTANNNKVNYCIGNVPALGRVTNPQGHTKVYGDDDTRFLEQLKVGYDVTVGNYQRTITSITSNSEMTVNQAFTGGINARSQMYFSGKLGTGEVSTSAGSTDVIGTTDVTATKFNEELALGYMLIVGSDYRVITGIQSASKLKVDLAFQLKTHTPTSQKFGYYKNSFNYESCFTNTIGEFADSNEYTGKHVYVEDACEIKPGCCGFKLSSRVYPDRFAYYKVRPSHSNMNIRVVAKTVEDNIDLVAKKDSVPTTTSYDYTSVRESNPWAISIPHGDITCGEAYVGYNVSTTLGDQAHISSPLSGVSDDTRTWTADQVDLSADDTFAPSNCSFFYIGVRGDNRYPQKTGASEYDLYVYTEFEFPNFLCADASSYTSAAANENACRHLGLTTVEDANFLLNTDDDRAVMRLTPNSNMRKGAMWYSTKVHLYDGFETQFEFRMSGFTVGCNSVLYPSGFCGGGDGFAFLIHEEPDGDQDIGCYGGALGFGTITAADQGDDWARPRCISHDETAATTFYSLQTDSAYLHRCDSGCSAANSNLKDCTDRTGSASTRFKQDDGNFDEYCVPMALCNPEFNGCGGTCGMPDCSQAIGRVVGVEFDTWNNLNLHDPKQGVSRWWINATEFVGYNDNHIAVFSSDSSIGTSTDHASPNHFGATPSIPNLADGQIHTVKIKYWPQAPSYRKALKKDRGQGHTTGITTHGDCQDNTGASNAADRNPAPDHCTPIGFTGTPGNLAIFIDDMKKPKLQVKISLRMGDASGDCHDNDIDRCVLDNQGNAYIGFSASTGGERIGITYDTTTFVAENLFQENDETLVLQYTDFNGQVNAAYEAASLKTGAAQIMEILSWRFCNMIGCVAI